MTVESSPTVRRRQLAAELRRLRLAAKLTIEQVAEQLEWSQGKVSKIENARVSVLPRDVRHLLNAYGVGDGDDREALLVLAAQSRQRGWWQQYGEAVPAWFQTYVGLEAETAAIALYQAEYVPGLLQTRDYAIAVHSAARMNASGDEIEQQVAVRMQRQARLTGDGAPQLWVVLNEAVVRRLVGDRATMHEQLVKLSKASSALNITLQVLPFVAGAHPVMDSAFSLLTFDRPAASDVVYFEYPTGALYVEKPDEVARYRRPSTIYAPWHCLPRRPASSWRDVPTTWPDLRRCEVNVDLSGATWRKSTYSNGNGGNCVEATTTRDGSSALRDSKNPGGPALLFSARRWRTFIRDIKLSTSR